MRCYNFERLAISGARRFRRDCRVWHYCELVSMRTETNFLARRFVSIFLFSFCLVGLLVPPAVLADQAPAVKAHRKSSKKSGKQLPQSKSAPAVPSGPLQALPLDQIPSSAPQVKYEGHQLTIVSRNSTLGDILRAVKTQTGAVVEMPSNSTERVVGSFGPGPARDVLATLLNGSHFNYVLLGSPANAAVLDRVILITKSGPDEVGSTVQASAAQPGNPQTPLQLGPGQVPPDGDAADAADDVQDDADDSSATVVPDDGQQQPGNPGSVKTPEQLLQELQRQQVIQQQQQQQNGVSPQGFPAPQPFQQNLQQQ
jgi:hypothetical protein